MAEGNELEGVLLVDKPSGMTSHDVVARMRRILRTKRIGHAGTLDPLATGLLIILVGRATKLSQFLTSLDKEYEGAIKLGESTATQDADGEIVSSRPVPALSLKQVTDFCESFLGDQYQTPPMYSAIKIDGVPLYKMARKGKEVEREPRFVRISAFDVLGYEEPLIRFHMRCSKGTYVRTVAHDLGERINCGAHLASLRRTASDRFHIRDAVTLDQLETMPIEDIAARLIPSHQAAPNLVL